MNTKVAQSRGPQAGGPSSGEIVRYAAALLLVAAGIFGFYWFTEWPSALRALLVVAAVGVAITIFATSAKGADTREFLSESRFELRKVVWPTRQEALRTTWVVMLAVLILSLLLAGFDVVIQAAVKFLLGR